MSVLVKISFAADGKSEQRNYRTVKLELNQLVQEALRAFGSKSGATSLDDYGFFLYGEGVAAEDPNPVGKWLANDAFLSSYDLSASSIIEFKKKTRLLKVELLDGSHKTISIDDTAPTTDVVVRACKKFGLENPEEYSVQIKGWRENEWLNEQRSLRDQNVDDDDTVVLKKRFFLDEVNLETISPAGLQALYAQTQKAIISGTLPCSMELGVQLAGLQRQIEAGNFDATVHTPASIQLMNVLPPLWRRMRSIEDDINKEHQRIAGLMEDQAKQKYLAICTKLPTFGCSMFAVKERMKQSRKFTIPFLLGVNREGVLRLDPDSKDIVAQFPFTQLKRWAHTDTTLSLDFGRYQSEILTVRTNEGMAINSLIGGYVGFIVQRSVKNPPSVPAPS